MGKEMFEPDNEVLSRLHEPWVLPVREPIGISDETVAAITQAVTQIFAELALAGKFKAPPTKRNTETKKGRV